MTASAFTSPIGILLSEAGGHSFSFYLIATSYVISTGLFFLAIYIWLPAILNRHQNLQINEPWRSEIERKIYLSASAIIAAVAAMVLSVTALPFFALLLASLLAILVSVKNKQDNIHWSCHVLGAVSMLALFTETFTTWQLADLQVLARSFMWTFAYASLTRFYFYIRGRSFDNNDDLLLFCWLGLGLGDFLPKAMLMICASFLVYALFQNLRQKAVNSMRDFPGFLVLGLSLAHLLT